MKISKTIKPLLICCVMPFAFAANAEDLATNKKNDFNFVTIKAGLDQPVVSNNNANVYSVDSTYMAGIEVGRSFKELFAVSVEYNHKGLSNFNTADTSKSWGVKSDALMLNLSASLMQDAIVTPYIKAGVGASMNRVNNYVTTDATYSANTKTNFAWQVGLGVNMPYNDHFDVDLAYMFTDRGKAETKNNTKSVILKDHAMIIGIKFKY